MMTPRLIERSTVNHITVPTRPLPEPGGRNPRQTALASRVIGGCYECR